MTARLTQISGSDTMVGKNYNCPLCDVAIYFPIPVRRGEKVVCPSCENKLVYIGDRCVKDTYAS